MSQARNQRRLEKKRNLKVVNANIQQAMEGRPCGDCTACCTAMGVSELDKPVGVPCSHLCEAGCGIYEERPVSCKDFNCLWRYGLLDAEHRPDELGLVFDITGHNRFGMKMLVAREARPGAFETAKPVLDRLIQEGHVIILVEDASGSKRRIIGPPEKVERINKTIKIVARDNGLR